MPSSAIPGQCLAGTVALLDATGDAGVLTTSITLILTAYPAQFYFSVDGGCTGTATELDQVLPAGSSVLQFWAQPRYSDTITISADDSPRLLPTASTTIDVAAGPAAQVAFDRPTYEIYAGQQTMAYVDLRDAYGNSTNLFSQPETITVQSADPDAGLLLGFQGCPQDAGPTEYTLSPGASMPGLCISGPRGTYTAVASTPDFGSATATVNICPGPGAGCSSGNDCCADLQCSASRCCLRSAAYAHTLDCSDCCSRSCFTNNPPTCY